MPQTTSTSHEVTVRLNVDQTAVCVPEEITVKHGDEIKWIGEDHNGFFEGKITGPQQSDFTKEQLSTLVVAVGEANKPTKPSSWTVGQVLTVKPDAAPGAYKYSVTVHKNGLTFVADPVVIIDDGSGH